MDQIKIGAFLKALRKEKNLTQEQAAEQLGVSVQRQGKQLAEAIPVSDRFGRCRCSCVWNLVSGFIDRRIKPGR